MKETSKPNNIFLFSTNKDGLEKIGINVTADYQNKIYPHKDNPNVFFCDIFHYNIDKYTNTDGTINKSQKDAYWEYINQMISQISETTPKSNLHLILHIGDDNSSLDVTGSTSFWKDISFNTKKNSTEEIAANNINFKKNQITDNRFDLQTVWGFHHTPALGIFGKIIMFDEQKGDENVLKDSEKLLGKLLEIYEDSDLRYAIIKDFKNEYYSLKDGNKNNFVNTNNENYIKKLKLSEECKSELLKKGEIVEFLTIFTNENFLKDRDFYICLANLQLCGCNTNNNYKNFSSVIVTNKDNYFKQIVNTRNINPKFDSNEFSKDIKPIIIYGTKALSELQKGYDRRINYLDSSIWLQYVSNQEEFNKAKENVAKWKELYNTINAKEIVEFKARQLKNSFLREIEENASHAQNVVPFLFHSETKMLNKAVVPLALETNNRNDKSELEKLEQKENLQWRFLLVDDHSTKKSIDKSEKDGATAGSIIPKCKIINSILSEHFNVKCHRQKYDTDKTEATECCQKCCPNPSEDKNITIWLDCADKMNDVIKKLKTTKYDLILLDYLLDTDKKTAIRNYAHNLLDEIEKNCTNDVKKEDGKIEGKWTIKNNKIGPNGKFQMFYISAFTNAVKERMLEQGNNYHSDYWHISHGACPTTTPYLFLFYLLRRMNSQIKEFTELSKKEELDITTLLDLLLEIYGEEKKSREQAIKLFNPLLKLRLNYDNLKYDVCKGKKCVEKLPPEDASKLVNSLFPDIPHYDNAFWEHTMHLVYLTAYGTIRQWHDMWEEFMLIKPNLLRIPNNVKVRYKDENGNISNDKTAKDITNGIEKYITDLQTQSR